MPAVASVCANTFTLDPSLTLRYCSNGSLDQPDPAIKRAIVVLHGNGRNGPSYYQSVLTAANTAGVTGESIIIAPHFLTEEDINQHLPGTNVAFWSDDGWKQGDESLSTTTNPRAVTMSSFKVADLITARLADPAFFPNLQLLIIAGHSAGGQFVNRYAAAHSASVSTVYIVANPASYLYMNRDRRASGTTDSFKPPPLIEQLACLSYDHYRYGLTDLNPYMKAIGKTNIKARYSTREVVYLLGTEDNDPNHPELGGCEARFQGDHRFERAQSTSTTCSTFTGH